MKLNRVAHLRISSEESIKNSKRPSTKTDFGALRGHDGPFSVRGTLSNSIDFGLGHYMDRGKP